MNNSHRLKVFHLKISEFDIQFIEEYLNKFGVRVFQKKSRTYKERILSQFIRYFVFTEIYKLPEVVFFKNVNGKPYLSNSELHFSISHGFDLVVMTVADKYSGVDAELIRTKKAKLDIAKRFFTPIEYEVLQKSDSLEQDFFSLWTLKEAQVKRSSLGISGELSRARFKMINSCWYSENKDIVHDFYTYFYQEYVISICSENIDKKQLDFLKINQDLQLESLDI